LDKKGWKRGGVVFEQFENSIERVQLGRDGVELGTGLADLTYELVDAGRRLDNRVADC